MNNVRPQLTMLTEEQKHDIHQYTMKLLATTGVRVDSPSALEMLKKTVGSSMVEERTVRFPQELVEWAIESAPSEIQIYDRRGNEQFLIGNGDRIRFGIGVTALYYQDPMTDTPELFQRKHMQDMVRLGNRLPHYDVVSTIGIVRDVPEHLTDLYGSLEHFANGIKPMVLLCSDEHKFDDVMQMFELLHGGDLGAKPFIIPYFNPVSPLVMNQGTVDKMKIAIERGLPVIISNYSMSGATTPITPAGTITVLLAELLAGLTIGQLFR